MKYQHKITALLNHNKSIQMKTTIYSLKYILFFTAAFMFITTLKAQSTKALNVLIPMSIVDKTINPINKSIGGIGASVNITVNSGIKYLDGCSEDNVGSYKGEFNWYDANDETGKFLLQMVKQPANIEQQKKTFFGQSVFDLNKSKIEDFAGGTLRYIAESKPCVNEITGSTGKTEYITQAKFFAFNGNTMIKIDLSSKIKIETIKTTIAKIVDEAKKFDFAVYKTTTIAEQE